MPLEIEDLGRFGTYVANEAVHLDPKRAEGEPSVYQKIRCAERWGGLILDVTKQYGGKISDNVELGLRYAQKPLDAEYPGPIAADDSPRYEMPVVMGAAEILSNFWTHREAFSKWLESQVLVTKVGDPSS